MTQRRQRPRPTSLLTAFCWAAVSLGLPGSGCEHPSEEQRFTVAVASRLRMELPAATVTIPGPLRLHLTGHGGLDVALSLDNLWRECRGLAAGCPAVDRYLRTFTAPANAPDQTVERARIRAVLKDVAWLGEADKLAAQGPPARRAANRLVSRPFVGDLAVVYVLDMPDGMKMLSEGDRGKLGLSVEQLNSLALRNLAAACSDLPSEPVEKGISLIHAGDSYEASRLLLPSLWQSVAASVKGDLLVAAPSRDFLLCTGSREDHDVLARFRQLVSLREQSDGHPLSTITLRWAPAGWELHKWETP
jgi:hypothetical protein